MSLGIYLPRGVLITAREISSEMLGVDVVLSDI
jgi:hypothetical protein